MTTLIDIKQGYYRSHMPNGPVYYIPSVPQDVLLNLDCGALVMYYKSIGKNKWRITDHKLLLAHKFIYIGETLTHTITINGKDIELSEESFNELKKQLT